MRSLTRIASAGVRLDNIDLIGCVGATAAAKLPYTWQVGKSFSDNSASAAAAGGRTTSKITGSVYAVHQQHLFLPLTIEIGFGVQMKHDKDEEYVSRLVGGVLVRVNSSGTYGMLLDSSRFIMAGSAEMIILSKGQAPILRTSR